MVLTVKVGVVKLPSVPVPPPPDEIHDVVLVDVQLMLDVAPLAMEDGAAVRVTLGNTRGIAETTLDAMLSPFTLTAVTTKK